MNEEQNNNMPVENSGKSKITLMVIALVVIVLAGGYYFFNSSKNEALDGTINTPPTENTSIQTPAQDLSTDQTQAVREFTIETKNYSFTPVEIKVKKGDTVKITLKNTEGFHDLIIDEFKVATKRLKSAGEEDTVQFVADKTGSFEYYCSVGNHRTMGMKGTLIVEE